MAKKAEQKVDVQAGDYVLLGRVGISRPNDWLLAQVLWTDGLDVLTHHNAPSNGERIRQVFTVDEVRAVGDHTALFVFQQDCAAKVREESRNVQEAESALRRAREAVWVKLDELAETVPVMRDENEQAA